MRRSRWAYLDAVATGVIVLSLVGLLLLTGEDVKQDGRRTREAIGEVRAELDAAAWLNDRLQRVALCALEARRPARCLRAFEREVDETPGPEPGETDPPGVTGPEPTEPPPPEETDSPTPEPEPTVDPLPTPTISLPTPTIPPIVCELLPELCN